jgi:hypothetical protein
MQQSISAGLSNLIAGVVTLLVGPTVCMYLLKRFVPVLGDELWRWYCRALIWLVRALFRLIRVLLHEALGIRRRP